MFTDGLKRGTTETVDARSVKDRSTATAGQLLDSSDLRFAGLARNSHLVQVEEAGIPQQQNTGKQQPINSTPTNRSRNGFSETTGDKLITIKLILHVKF